MTTLSAKHLILADDDPRSRQELEKLAVENLQLIIYQTNEELFNRWLPIVSSALNAGKMGETLILGFLEYAQGKHDELRATLRLLEAIDPNERLREVINFESILLQMRYEFNFGNFETMRKMYLKLPNIKTYPFTRNNDQHYSKHRGNLVSAFYLQDKTEFLNHYKQIENIPESEFGSISHFAATSFKSMRAFIQGSYLEANDYALAACKLANDLGINGAYTPFEAAYVLADTYLEFGEAKKSEEITNKYLAIAEKYNQYPWITAFYAKAALIKLQEGNINASLSLIRKGRESVEGPLFNTILSFHLDFHEILIRLPLGDAERIRELVNRLPELEAVKNFKLLLELNQNPLFALDHISKMPNENDQDKFRRASLLAMFNVQNRKEAMTQLEIAIEIAIPPAPEPKSTILTGSVNLLS